MCRLNKVLTVWLTFLDYLWKIWRVEVYRVGGELNSDEIFGVRARTSTEDPLGEGKAHFYTLLRRIACAAQNGCPNCEVLWYAINPCEGRKVGSYTWWLVLSFRRRDPSSVGELNVFISRLTFFEGTERQLQDHWAEGGWKSKDWRSYRTWCAFERGAACASAEGHSTATGRRRHRSVH